MQPVIVLDSGKPRIVPDIPGKAQTQSPVIRLALQKVQVVQIAAVKPDIPQSGKIGKEGGVPDGVGVVVTLEMDLLQRSAARDGRIVRDTLTVLDLQMFEILHPVQRGDIPQFMQIVDVERLQL